MTLPDYTDSILIHESLKKQQQERIDRIDIDFPNISPEQRQREVDFLEGSIKTIEKIIEGTQEHMNFITHLQ